ncbi:NACHT and WD repeat domain-containing protein 2-like [Tubulanus polymorphus]|uniref:NACHT and WD repeat domain-containing protein 2-like n=1 Tax=Tubulanus polymorphus TaxID=672921 RepID=UPI003DA486E6
MGTICSTSSSGRDITKPQAKVIPTKKTSDENVDASTSNGNQSPSNTRKDESPKHIDTIQDDQAPATVTNNYTADEEQEAVGLNQTETDNNAVEDQNWSAPTSPKTTDTNAPKHPHLSNLPENVFLNEKLGLNAPANFYVDDFEMLLLDVQNDDKKLLNEWYRLDENHIPPAYILQPISLIIPDYLSEDDNLRRAAVAKWTQIAARIHQLLTNSLSADSVYLKTDFEQEIEEILIRNGTNAAEKVIWLNRKFSNMPETPIIECHQYRDVYSDEYSIRAKKRIQNLSDHLQSRLSTQNIIHMDIEWSSDGKVLEDNVDYLTDVCTKYEGVLQRIVHQVITTDKELCEQDGSKCIHNDLYSELCAHTCVANNVKVHLGGEFQDEQNVNATLALLHELPDWEDAALVVRFFNLTPNSQTMHQVLLSSCLQMGLIYGIDSSETIKPQCEYKTVLIELFRKVDKTRPLLWIIDGIDSALGKVCLENVLPSELPTHVRMVLTVNSENQEVISKLQTMYTSECFLKVEPLPVEDNTNIFIKSMEENQREITGAQKTTMNKVLSNSSFPLHACLYSSIASTWKSYQRVELPELPEDLTSLICTLFSLLEVKFGQFFIDRALSCLTASLHGLSFSELKDMLSCDDKLVGSAIYSVQEIPSRTVFQILDILEPYLNIRYSKPAPVYSWKHSIFNQICRDRYDMKSAHSILAKYFRNELASTHRMCHLASQEMKFGDEYNHRSLLLTTSQLILSGRAQDVVDDLFNLDWLCAKVRFAGILQTLSDIHMLLAEFTDDEDLKKLHEFISGSIYILYCSPDMLPLQLFLKLSNQDLSSAPKMLDLLNCCCTMDDHYLVPNKNQMKYFSSIPGSFSPILTGCYSLKTSSDFVVTLSEPLGEISVWSLQTGQIQRTLTGIKSPKDLKTIDDTNVAVLCDREIIVYDLNAGEFKSKMKGVLNVKMPYYEVRNKDHIICLSRNRMHVNIMNIETGDMEATFKVGEDRFLNSLLVSDNGQVCVCGDEVQKPFPLLVWDLENRKLLHDLRIPQHEFLTSMSAITNDGHYVVCVCKELEDSSSDFLIVYDLIGGQLFKKLKPACNKVVAVSISSESQVIVAGLENNNIVVWDLVAGAHKFTLKGHSAPPNDVQLSKDGRRCLSYNNTRADPSIRLWDLETETLVGAFASERPTTSHLLTDDGSAIVLCLPGIEEIITLRTGKLTGEMHSDEKERPEIFYGDEDKHGKTFNLEQSAY